MNVFSLNDLYVLSCLERLGVRKSNPCSTMHLLDKLKENYRMSREEAISTIVHLGEIGYVDGNDRFISFSDTFDDMIFKEKEKTMDKEYSLQEKKAARFKLLETIYKEAGGSESAMLNIHEVGQSLGFAPELTRLSYEYLRGENLIEFKALGGLVSLTHYGIREYEQAIEAPEIETKYFPAANIVNNILHIGKIENSQVQVGTANSTQVINKNKEFDELVKWIMEIEKALITEKMEETVDKIKEEIESIKTLLSAEKPNKKYINMAMATIKDLMIGVASNALFQQLAASIPVLIP